MEFFGFPHFKQFVAMQLGPLLDQTPHASRQSTFHNIQVDKRYRCHMLVVFYVDV